MKTKKGILKVLCLSLAMVMMVGLFAGCAKPAPATTESSTTTAPEPAKTYSIKVSIAETLDPKISNEAVAALKFKEEVEKNSNGAIKVEIFPGGTLGEADSILDQTKNNIIQVAAIADAKIAGFYAPIQVLSIPYLFSSREHAYKVLDSGAPIMNELVEDMAKQSGLRLISFGENGGFRSFSNSKREIKTPADMAGLKIRTMNSPLHMDIVKNLGAVPVPLGISELYTGLQTKTVDGQENAPAVTQLYHFEEVQKYYTLDKHVYSITTFVLSEKFYQSLPDDLKKVVTDAGNAAAKANRQACQDKEQIILEDLKAKGMTVYEPTAEEFEAFKAATQQPAIEWLKKNVDAKWIDGITSLVESSK